MFNVYLFSSISYFYVIYCDLFVNLCKKNICSKFKKSVMMYIYVCACMCVYSLTKYEFNITTVA